MKNEHARKDLVEEDLSEPDRYDTAEGWDPYEKQRKTAPNFTFNEPSPFRVLNGDELAKMSTRIKESGKLFGSLWREGEVAVLFGETGVGKSILAVQIAESIATGAQASPLAGSPRVSSLHVSKGSSADSQLPAQQVLYLDFERTLDQFRERYSVRRRPTSSRRIRYKFSSKFNRVDLAHFLDVAGDVKGDLSRYLRDAVCRFIASRTARVVIIDNISYLSSATGNSAGARLMKTLKLWAGLYQVSILAVAHMKTRRKPAPTMLAAVPQFASLADSVFAIAPSSMSPDIRYIKHLKSNSVSPGQKRDSNGACIPVSTDTLVFRLERLSEPGAIATGLLHFPDSSLTSPVSSLSSPVSSLPTPPLPDFPTPFLGLTCLGHAAEHEHLRDYEREARDAHEREQNRLRQWHRSSRTALIEGYFDGSYAKYLKS